MSWRGLGLGAVGAAVVGVSLAPATPAAAETRVTISGRITPVIRLPPRRAVPVGLSLALHFSGDEDGGLPPILQKATMWFPFGATLNATLFPGCAANTINRRGARACPAGSQIGAGTAVGVGANVVEHLGVRLFNGPSGRSIVFLLRGDNPLRVNTAFEAPLAMSRTGRFEYRLTVPVPANLQNVAGVDLAVRNFATTVRASRRLHGKTRGYIEAWACPPGALVPLRGVFDFADSASVTTNAYIGCD